MDINNIELAVIKNFPELTTVVSENTADIVLGGLLGLGGSGIAHRLALSGSGRGFTDTELVGISVGAALCGGLAYLLTREVYTLSIPAGFVGGLYLTRGQV